MTEYFIGRREQIAIVEEDGGYATLSSNTVANAGIIPGKNVRIEPAFDHAWQEVISAGADSREIASAEKGPVTYGFTMSFIVTDWKFLKYCAHGNVTNTGGGPNYTHTFTLKDDVLSFTLEWSKRGSTDHVVTVSGCVIRTVSLKFQRSTGTGEGFVTATCQCIGQSAASGTSTSSVSVSSDSPFQFRMAKLTLAGSEVTEVNNGEITITNGINENDSRYANSTLNQNIGEPIPTVVRYTSRFNINVSDDTYYDFWAAFAAIGSTNKLELIRTASTDTMVFTFTNKYVQTANMPTNLEGVNNVDLVSVLKTVAPVAIDQQNDY